MRSTNRLELSFFLFFVSRQHVVHDYRRTAQRQKGCETMQKAEIFWPIRSQQLSYLSISSIQLDRAALELFTVHII